MDSLGIYGVIDKAAEMGFDGIEFVDMPWMNVSDDELTKIGQYARDKALRPLTFAQAPTLSTEVTATLKPRSQEFAVAWIRLFFSA